jgi:hypothetical protein
VQINLITPMNNPTATFKLPTSHDICECLKTFTETLYAIELLEYHNKNYLSGDNKSRSELRQGIHKNMLEKIQYIKNLPNIEP